MIIGIAGKKRAGKDTVLGCIQHYLAPAQVMRVAFADKLKQEVAKATGVTGQHIDTNKELFRPILQWWGTDFRRKHYGDNYWIKRWQEVVDYMQSHMHDVVIVAPDVRFVNEVNAIHANGGFVIRVDRPTEERDEHASECELDLYDFKHIVINNGTIPVLAHQVRLVLQEHKLIK